MRHFNSLKLVISGMYILTLCYFKIIEKKHETDKKRQYD